MEKFFSNPRGNTKKNGSDDLLSLLKNKKQENQAEKCSSSAEMDWKIYDSKNVNVTDIECDIKAGILKNKNYVGWKTDGEGKRIYTTFRAGQRVQAEGHEAFKLAFGDGKIKKRKASEIIEISEADTQDHLGEKSKAKTSKTASKGKESELHPKKSIQNYFS